MKLTICFLVLLSYSAIFQAAQGQNILNQEINSGWRFRQVGNLTWHPAQVPGTVHLDLIANGTIPDPYYRDNIDSVQWVEEEDWQYYVQFNITNPAILQKDVIELVFEGLDTHAMVNLNNRIILNANNMFRRWVVNVKGILNATNNTLSVVFRSAVRYDNYSAAVDFPLILPAENTRIYSRKAAYHYGWDWGPRLVTCGIWKPVYINAWNLARIDSVFYKQVSLTDQVASISAILNVTVNNASSYNIKIFNSVTNTVYATKTVVAVKGVNNITVNFTINNPQLWWVRGYGSQPLYNITTQISSISNQLLDQKWHNIGLRTVELVTVNDSIGSSFYFKINGRPIFAKGGNYIPPDMFMPRVNYSVYNQTLQAALDANYNFIRVWGGGNYENDIFYDICDQVGLLVWQDFMFANGMYSARQEYLDNIKEELIDNIKRIRNHPSIIVWVGNNEILEGWINWDWKEDLRNDQIDLIFNWYQEIFQKLIPSVLVQFDGTRPYWPTSPLYGWGHNESILYGDSHYWAVWAGEKPIEYYINHTGRFVSEYGMQGMLCMDSMKKFSIQTDWNFNTPTMLAHEKHVKGWDLLKLYMNYFKKISDFQKFAYGTQIMQKYALQIAIEAHRRNKPVTMGTLVWQLNDVWPVFSWSTRDFYGTWKAAHYMIRQMYSDVIISFAHNNISNATDIYIISDKTFDFNATLNVTVMNLNGTVYLNQQYQVIVPQDSSKVYASVLDSQVKQWTFNNTILVAELTYGFDAGYTENHYYFVTPNYLNLTQPKIKYTIDPLRLAINFTTDVFAMGTYLYNNQTLLSVSDNYFDLIPGRVKSVKFHNITVSQLTFSIMTIFDAYDKNVSEETIYI